MKTNLTLALIFFVLTVSAQSPYNGEPWEGTPWAFTYDNPSNFQSSVIGWQYDIGPAIYPAPDETGDNPDGSTDFSVNSVLNLNWVTGNGNLWRVRDDDYPIRMEQALFQGTELHSTDISLMDGPDGWSNFQWDPIQERFRDGGSWFRYTCSFEPGPYRFVNRGLNNSAGIYRIRLRILDPETMQLVNNYSYVYYNALGRIGSSTDAITDLGESPTDGFAEYSNLQETSGPDQHWYVLDTALYLDGTYIVEISQIRSGDLGGQFSEFAFESLPREKPTITSFVSAGDIDGCDGTTTLTVSAIPEIPGDDILYQLRRDETIIQDWSLIQSFDVHTPGNYTVEALEAGYYTIVEESLEVQKINCTSGPYLGSPATLPGTIQFEYFDTGGDGIAYHETSSPDENILNWTVRNSEENGLFGADIEETGTDTVSLEFSNGFYPLNLIGEWYNYSVTTTNENMQFQLGYNGYDKFASGQIRLEFWDNEVLVDSFLYDVNGRRDYFGGSIPPGTSFEDCWWDTTYTYPVCLPIGDYMLRVAANTNRMNMDRMEFLSITPVSPLISTNLSTMLQSGLIGVVANKNVNVYIVPESTALILPDIIDQSLVSGNAWMVDTCWITVNYLEPGGYKVIAVDALGNLSAPVDLSVVDFSINLDSDRISYEYSILGTVTHNADVYLVPSGTEKTANTIINAALAHTFALANEQFVLLDAPLDPGGYWVYAISTDYMSAITEPVDVTIISEPEIYEWPTASPITFGQRFGDAVLSGGSAYPWGNFNMFDYFYVPPSVGEYLAEVIYDPSVGYYDTIHGYVDLTVLKATPVISGFPVISDIVYENSLSEATLTGGAASVPGSFSFAAPSYQPPAGVYTADVIFTPTDIDNYNTVTISVDVNVAKADPIVTTWPSASNIVYGSNLGASILSGGIANVPGSYAFNFPDYHPVAGNSVANVTFYPTDSDNYNTIESLVNVSVEKADPGVSEWPVSEGITYEASLSASTLSGGTATIAGSFSYESPDLVPGAGTYSAVVLYIPTDSDNYATVSATVDVEVAKADPVITTMPAASAIVYGQALSNSTLSGAVVDVVGSFAFDAPDTQPDAGTFTAAVTFTPTDAANYNLASASVDVEVAKADPVITTMPAASAIVYGQALSNSTLSGAVVDVVGSFAFDAPDTQPDAGTYTAAVTFTPTDAANYNLANGTVDLEVAKADPVVTTMPAASAIVYGQALSNSTLSGAVVDVVGSFAFDAPDTQPAAGTYTAAVTFTPTDAANYNLASASVDVEVAKADPVITTMPAASAIVYGQALSNSTLSGAVVDVVGSFAFDAPDTQPAAGTYTAAVTFTPTDAANYNLANGTVDLEVAKADPVVTTMPAASAIVYGQALSNSTLSGAVVDVVGSFAFDAPDTQPAAGTYTAAVTFTPTDAANYNLASATVDVEISKAILDAAAKDTSKIEFRENPVFDIIYSGFVLDDTVDDLDELPVASTDAVTDSPFGEYDIVVSGGSDDNYSFNYIQGTFTIEDNVGFEESAGFTMRIYPNPSREIITIEIGSSERQGFEMTIMDQLGKDLFIVNIEDDITQIDMSQFAPGMYYLRIANEEGRSKVQKIVVN